MKLNRHNLHHLAPEVRLPAYDLAEIRQGMVHIGVGGFHRAHQAYYTDALMNTGEGLDWGICGVGLRAEDRRARDDLAGQDCLFTLFELGDSAAAEVRVIGAIRDMLLAEDGAQALIDKLADPQIRIVSLTITEGGYCIDDSSGEFMAHLPQIQHDLAHPQQPKTLFGFLCAALALRRTAGVPAFTLMSCDNLPHNGAVTRKALLAFARQRDADLHDWIAANVSFPNAMVDRITPMTSTAHRLQLHDQHGIDDAWPVVCEPFAQWVLEDQFVSGRPAWEKVGVQFTDDVTPYEEMKIKLLNGSHLALTYLGFLKGYRFVHETMADPLFVAYMRAYMDLDVTPQLAPVPGIDLNDYKDTLVARFSNRAIADQLERVCSDGSSKLPKFSVPTLNRLIADGRDTERAALVVAAWALYLKGVDENGATYSIPDPRAGFCQALVADDALIGQRLLAVEEIFGTAIPASAEFTAAFERCYSSLRDDGVTRTLERILARGR
ncbi:mannitol dehydrogenase family protein [Pseudomonas chlororaphis]|uniref:Mannitol dehydrogenase n=1 Tax=Pseudomonas chlororaphis TaxID=587753 RepID=A0AAX3FMW6_9PSED|nr:mannitol dehydrogenase family protein [Pseudomonas chlororaphis]AZC37487.1 Multiple polyol-specific dehydrogenase [Pseudomonas chlororaphis subsp. piscium]AZC44036.1 Multiple polyol-specific dehydrogenase [Pseudomonas chlororaphis subsp. piscium]AZC50690.1 Multiple polyol-specific dehydrogenase [Pseudomonas chlororaphis subsp. piscium]WDG75882.1 mannitol dehydrogenase family protein [Pseudomonas chlororaphis]WDH26483.1 mannitol dehydrogenase family protein [Pseudomonas chlororaphis]